MAQSRPVGVVQRSTENIGRVDDSARPKCKLLIQKQGKQAEGELPLRQGLMEQLALEASVPLTVFVNRN
jgi:hypothetical protein